MDKAVNNSKINLDPYGIFSSSTANIKAWLNNPVELSEQLTNLAVEIWFLED